MTATTVQLALTPDGSWATTPAELARAAAAAGFATLGISGASAGPEAAEAFAQAGVRCHEVLALVLSADEDATVASAERLTAAAEAMGADWVLTIFRARLDERTVGIVQRCAQLFTDAGAGMAVEFSPLGPVTSIPRGLEVVRAATAAGARAGLMIDSWHFSFGDSTWDDLAAVPLDEIAYVQFTDALAPESSDLMSETMNRRAPAGEGTLELTRFAEVLRDRGFDGLVSTEVLSAELRARPVPEVVTRLYETTAPYWI